MKRYIHGDISKGAVLIEAAFALPIVMTFFFAILWLATVLHATLTVHWATGQAVRLAITRGDPRRAGSAVVPTLGGVSTDSPDRDPLYATAGTVSVLSGTNDWSYAKSILAAGAPIRLVNRNWKEATPSEPVEVAELSYKSVLKSYDSLLVESGSTPKEFPAIYMYGLGYANNLIYESLGRQVRYPCDPLGTDANRADGAGCLTCKFKPARGGARALFNKVHDDYKEFIPTNSLALECIYAVSPEFIQPIVKLLSALGIDTSGEPFTVVVRSKKQVNVEVPNYLEARL